MTLKKIAYYTISFFFWIVLIQQLMVIFHLPQVPLLSLFAVVNACLGVYCMFHIPNFQKIDLLVIVYLAYILFSIFIADYKNQWEYISRAMVTQVPYIFFYFIGRASGLSLKEVLGNMKWPILLSLVCGLYFFFYEPSWYSAMKQAQIREYATELNIMEIYRLSGFWGHPYVLSYASFLYTLYLLDEYFSSNNEEEDDYYYIDSIEKDYEYFDNEEIIEIAEQEETKSYKKRIFIILQLILIGFVILLGQLRIVLLMFICAITYYLYKKSKMNLAAKNAILVSIIILTTTLLYIAQSILPDSNIEYITNHISELFEANSTTERLKYTSGGTRIEDPIFGNGFAKYNIIARDHNLFAMIDSEYQKHYYETGYVGVGLIILLLAGFAVCLLKQPKHEMEKMYLLFIMLASIGASVLSNSTQYAYIFWFAMGASNYPKEELEGIADETKYLQMQ